ncbi:MAG: hypothetical protein SAK29_16695 [Scytonema sp. PMC 1069.18]|nr:hypothetical protein [Scytonema sp. PMC 1069.18]MEC4887562.1 hypothetical protein [Scytonema sp. PMC 1070.18]
MVGPRLGNNQGRLAANPINPKININKPDVTDAHNISGTPLG